MCNRYVPSNYGNERLGAIAKISVNNSKSCLFVCLFFVALRPKSTAMVIAGRSVHLTTLFPGQA